MRWLEHGRCEKCIQKFGWKTGKEEIIILNWVLHGYK
jgi:hypothetical protein